MAVIGQTELQASNDVSAGVEAGLRDLFDFSERSKQFIVGEEVKRDSKLKVNVNKFGVVEISADSNLQAGFNTSLATLLNWDDSNKKVKVADAIKKRDTLTVSLEN